MRSAAPLHRELVLTSFPVEFSKQSILLCMEWWAHRHILRDRPDAPQPVQLLTAAMESLLQGKLNTEGRLTKLLGNALGRNVSLQFLWEAVRSPSHLQWVKDPQSIPGFTHCSICELLTPEHKGSAGTIHHVNVVIDSDQKVINLTGNRGKYSCRHQGHGDNSFPSNL